ncbi:MAG: hypothetical protein ABSE73_07855, partial [Planctomycetota bacterium]
KCVAQSVPRASRPPSSSRPAGLPRAGGTPAVHLLTCTLCDLPSEARLNPSLWGRFDVVKEDGKLKLIGAKKSLEPEDLTLPGKGDDKDLRLEP